MCDKTTQIILELSQDILSGQEIPPTDLLTDVSCSHVLKPYACLLDNTSSEVAQFKFSDLRLRLHSSS